MGKEQKEARIKDSTPLKCSFCFKKILGKVIWKNILPACEICEEKLFGGVNHGLEEELRRKELIDINLEAEEVKKAV